MREDIKYAFYMIILGCGLVAYAHTTFSTKTTQDRILDKLDKIDQRIYDIHTKLFD